jgi:hypothetical protein
MKVKKKHKKLPTKGFTGRHHTEESKEKIKESMEKAWKEHPELFKLPPRRCNKGMHIWAGKIHPRLGKTPSKESNEKRSCAMKGRKFSEEHKQKMSKARKKFFKENPDYFNEKVLKNMSMSQIKRLQNSKLPKQGNFKTGIRKDLGHYVRSSWEANVCRVLKFLGETYEYEKHFFELDNSSRYLPEIFIPSQNLFLEVKGFWYEKEKRKFQLFKEKYPYIKIIVVDKPIYIRLKEEYSKIIPNWEQDCI